MDVRVDAGMEQVSLGGDFLLPSAVKSAFSLGNVLVLDGFLYDRGTVVANLSYNTDILKAGKGAVY